MLLIGSKAAIMHGIFLGRNPRDFDFICTIDEYEAFCKKNQNLIKSTYPLKGNHMVAFFNNGQIIEFDIAWNNSSSADILDFESRITKNSFECYGYPFTVASSEILLLLKLSHRYLKNSPHFLKSMSDIMELRKCVSLSTPLKKLLKKREKETYTYSHPKLNQNKNDFFDSSVDYTHNHDDIHKAIAVDAQPAYELFKDDTAEVFCSKTKFFALAKQQQINAVLEEAYVLAIERSLVPFPGRFTPKEAFLKALEKICTSITSGWFRGFSYEHFYEVIQQYDDSYFGKFQQALNNGKISRFERQ